MSKCYVLLYLSSYLRVWPLSCLTIMSIKSIYVCGIIWYGVVCKGMVWCGMMWCGMVWYGMVWCGVAWYDMI